MAPSTSLIFPPDQVEGLLAAPRRAVEESLASYCASSLFNTLGVLAPVVRYSVLSGGKRFRGVLLCATYGAVRRGCECDAAGLAAAIEVVHSYSLVHDDLPCMDDDDLRRGRPSAHRQFSVKLATAAGMAMVPLAVRIAVDASQQLGASPSDSAGLVRELMSAAGAGGMVAGQLLDLEGEGLALPLLQLEQIHAAKTGALIAAAARIGAVAAGATTPVAQKFARFGELLGLAFQITDDLLDVTGSTAELGKVAGRDVALRKRTYPALMGVDAARKLAFAKAEEALHQLVPHNLCTPLLQALASNVVGRQS
jgi:geranylgeranyl pyrophosphate synthase